MTPTVEARVVAWHGLAGTGRGMDELAAHLLGLGWRVVCPDVVDRGLSHWVGGAIGAVLASGFLEPGLRQRIRSLVLNDNAPELAAPALGRIKAYVGCSPAFACVTGLEAFLRSAYKPYGQLG